MFTKPPLTPTSNLFKLVRITSLVTRFKLKHLKAVASLPNNTNTYIILIGSGNYTEQINVTRSGPTYLLGQTTSPKSYKANTVNIIWRQAALLGDNAYTSTLTVAPNLNASLTGSGPTGFAVPDDTPFGCVDFRSYNLNFINDYLPYCKSFRPCLIAAFYSVSSKLDADSTTAKLRHLL